MVKKIEELADKTLINKAEEFKKNNKSKMYYNSNKASSSMNLDWLEKMEHSCIYVDEAISHPKLDLISEQQIVKIEKAKRISVASVKHLAKHTDFIEDFEPVTGSVKLSKILIETREEAYNTYENRMLYTLIFNMSKMIAKREEALENFKANNDQVLEYKANTADGYNKVKLELKINAEQLANSHDLEKFLEELNSIKERIARIKRFIGAWRSSVLFKNLSKLGVGYVYSPVNKTNVLISNVNYSEALELFEYIEAYDARELGSNRDDFETQGNDILKRILENSFLTTYFVLEAISPIEKKENEQLSKYAITMINEHLKLLIELILKSGINITEDEILKMVSLEMNKGKRELELGSNDIKDKFKEAIDQYLGKINDAL